VRHHIDVPDPLPFRVGNFTPPGNADASVGAEQIDASVFHDHPIDHRDNLGFIGDIYRDCFSAGNLVCDFSGTGFIYVRHDDGLRTLGRETRTQRAPDTIRTAGHDHDFVRQFHQFDHTPGSAAAARAILN
jgi:hypothetical protein